MLAAEATPTSGPMAGLAEHDAISREPLIACAVGFALMGVLLFVIFEKAEGVNRQQLQAAALRQPDIVSDVFTNPTTQPSVRPGYGTTSFAELSQSLTYRNDVAETRFQPQGSVQQLGAYLFNNQLVNLELAGLILTVAMIGAIVIARRRVVGTDPVTHAVGGGETVVGPATPIDDDPHSIPVYGTENPRQKAYPET
jgi:hypothetical protein